MKLIRTQKKQRIIDVDDNEEEDQQKTNEKIIYTNMEYGNKKVDIRRVLSQKSYQFLSCFIYITSKDCIYLSHERDIDSFFLSGPINERVNI